LARALQIGALTSKSVASILANGMAAQSARDPEPTAILEHANLRGPGYFH
jgi:hypothetical protein